MPTTALVALTTLASEGDARALVTALLGDHLIACGTLLPGGHSLYRWQGKVTEEAEVVRVAEDRSIEVGRAVRRGAGSASVRGAGAARVAGRAWSGSVSGVAHAGGGG